MELQTNRKNQIVLLFPYFGSNPYWFDYFILSCSMNKNIDWFFFTDCLYSKIKTDNVTFHSMTLMDFNKLASNKLGFKILIKYPYKLCDLKPAFGLIFSDYIQGYKFWGYGDIDLIYGNINKFLPFNSISNYDIISNHNEFVPGHLCLLKNIELVNNLFKYSPIYKRVFQSKLYNGFDEILNLIKVFPSPIFLKISKSIQIRYHLLVYYLVNKFRNKSFWYINAIKNYIKKKGESKMPKDFTSIVKHFMQKGDLNVKFKRTYNCDMMLFKEGIRNWVILWKDGTLRNLTTGEEIMYFHFMMSKNRKKFKIDKADLYANKFLISSEGIKQV